MTSPTWWRLELRGVRLPALTSNRRLRRRCERTLADLGLPSQVSDIPALVEHLQRSRQRPVHLSAIRMAGASGGWLPTAAGDHIFYEADTSRPHQDHIIAHELAHMLLDHQPTHAADEDIAGHLPEDFVSAGAWSRMCKRDGYTPSDEAEVEMLASLLLFRVVTGPGVPSSGQPLEVALRRRRP